jgi:hypothetical protein
MQREVCLKHRNNRREIILRVRTQIRVGSGVCSFCHTRRGCAQFAARAAHLRSSFKSRTPECQSGDAGAIPAGRTNFQKPTEPHNVCGGRQLAQFGLQNRTGSGQHRDAVPLFKSRGSQVGRQRPHKPSTSGFDSRPRHQFHGPLDHSGGHSPRKRESTVQSRGGPLFSNRGKVENQRSLISSPIVVRLHVPQPSRVGSRVKIASRL